MTATRTDGRARQTAGGVAGRRPRRRPGAAALARDPLPLHAGGSGGGSAEQPADLLLAATRPAPTGRGGVLPRPAARGAGTAGDGRAGRVAASRRSAGCSAEP